MPMLSVATILHMVKLIFLVTVFILGIVYITLSIIGHRLRTSIDLLLFNVCVACTLCASFWILYDILDIIRSPWLQDDDLCWFYSYAQNLSVCQVVYAFCFVSLNRYLMVTYASNMYFKRRQWALISMGAQWLLGCLLPAPLWLSQTCGRFGIPWSFQLYKLMFVIVIPTVFTVAIYGRLFLFTRISSLRVQQTGKKNALSNRDTRLLKHMVFVIAVYVGSWAPIYTVAATVQDVGSPDIVYGSLGVLPNVGLLIGTIDLFLYNNRFRKMLTRIHPSPAQ